jgi:hypothetical protein
VFLGDNFNNCMEIIENEVLTIGQIK